MPFIPDHDCYEVLGVPPTATAEEIHDRWTELVARVHPDVGGSAALFIQVNEAYTTLIDPASRADYDRARTAPAPGPTAPPSSAEPTDEPKATEHETWETVDAIVEEEPAPAPAWEPLFGAAPAAGRAPFAPSYTRTPMRATVDGISPASRFAIGAVLFAGAMTQITPLLPTLSGAHSHGLAVIWETVTMLFLSTGVVGLALRFRPSALPAKVPAVVLVYALAFVFTAVDLAVGGGYGKVGIVLGAVSTFLATRDVRVKRALLSLERTEVRL